MNRDKAINILEKHDNKWDYEDMEDEELLEAIVRATGCSATKQKTVKDCNKIACIECWRRTLI
ncbi:MAG: hypothetical protein AB9856_03675 [Cellulosilyticaceae bacterium]